MDGVPGLSFRGIAPGQTFHYRVPVKQSGTYWYHSHSRFQEQTGLSGALIIEPRDKDTVEFDREYVVFLSDWTDTNPETVFRNLKEQSDYYNYHRTTLPDVISQSKKKGLGPTASDFLWSANEQSGFNDPQKRMERDHKPMVRRKRQSEIEKISARYAWQRMFSGAKN